MVKLGQVNVYRISERFNEWIQRFQWNLFSLYREDSSLHLHNHFQFLPPFLLHEPTWSGLIPSLLTTSILVQNRSVRTKMDWLSCSFPKEISVNKWKPCSEGKYSQHNNLASKLCLKYKSHMSWNKITYSVVTMHRAGCTTSSWHCLKKLVLNTTWTEPTMFIPQWEAQIIKRKMCYHQHREMLWRCTKANMKHCNKH